MRDSIIEIRAMLKVGDLQTYDALFNSFSLLNIIFFFLMTDKVNIFGLDWDVPSHPPLGYDQDLTFPSE